MSQVHGFPKVMGVLTHLDEFTDPSKLKKVKKTLKVWQRDACVASQRLTAGVCAAPVLDRDIQRREAVLHQRHGSRAVQQARHAQPRALYLYCQGVWAPSAASWFHSLMRRLRAVPSADVADSAPISAG